MSKRSKTANNTVHASTLRPVLVTGLKEDIGGDEGYDGGLGRHAFVPELYVRITPWQMKLWDECRLYWRDTVAPIRLAIIDTPEKLDKEVIFALKGSEIIDGKATVSYTVTTGHQAPEKSVESILLVKRSLPGGELTQPEPEGHPKLLYSFIPDVSNGIDQEKVDGGVWMIIHTYPGMTIFDRIIAHWGTSEPITFYPVTQLNIDDPVNHPVRILFTKEIIEYVGAGEHSVTFQVHDRCGNHPHHFASWAIPTNVFVCLGEIKKLPPLTLEGEIEDQVDPTFLTELVADVPKEGLNLYDRVRVNWNGRIQRQTTEKTYLGGDTRKFEIPLEWARESDGREVSVIYEVRGRHSEPNVVKIKTTIELTPAKVLEAYGELGDRLKMADIYYDPHVTVEIPRYVGMAVGQTIRVRWASARNTYDSAITTVTAVGPMKFLVPRLEVVDAIGHTVNIDYTVRVYPKGPLHRSPVFALAVDPQPFVLTPPRLTLDQSTVTVRYPGMATGYHARVRWAGVATHKTDWQDLVTGVTEDFTIPPQWVVENKGKIVLVNYSVNQPGINQNSYFSQVLRLQL